MENACCSRPLFCPSQSEGSDWNPKAFPGVSPSLPSPCLTHRGAECGEKETASHLEFPFQRLQLPSRGWSDQRKQRISGPLSPATAATTAAESLSKALWEQLPAQPGEASSSCAARSRQTHYLSLTCHGGKCCQGRRDRPKSWH